MPIGLQRWEWRQVLRRGLMNLLLRGDRLADQTVVHQKLMLHGKTLLVVLLVLVLLVVVICLGLWERHDCRRNQSFTSCLRENTVSKRLLRRRCPA